MAQSAVLIMRRDMIIMNNFDWIFLKGIGHPGSSDIELLQHSIAFLNIERSRGLSTFMLLFLL